MFSFKQSLEAGPDSLEETNDSEDSRHFFIQILLPNSSQKPTQMVATFVAISMKHLFLFLSNPQNIILKLAF